MFELCHMGRSILPRLCDLARVLGLLKDRSCHQFSSLFFCVFAFPLSFLFAPRVRFVYLCGPEISGPLAFCSPPCCLLVLSEAELLLGLTSDPLFRPWFRQA